MADSYYRPQFWSISDFERGKNRQKVQFVVNADGFNKLH